MTDQYSPLKHDGGDDIGDYNRQLEAQSNPTWLAVEWLFAECYMYR